MADQKRFPGLVMSWDVIEICGFVGGDKDSEVSFGLLDSWELSQLLLMLLLVVDGFEGIRGAHTGQEGDL